MTNRTCLPVISAKEAVRKSCRQPNSSSPRKRGPRSKRLKSLGSRFRGNDGYEKKSARFRNWITAAFAGMTRIERQLVEIAGIHSRSGPQAGLRNLAKDRGQPYL